MNISEIEQLENENENLRSQLQRQTSDFETLDSSISDSYEWIWEVDTAGKYTYANKQVVHVLGYLPEEIIGKTPFDFMTKDQAHRVGKIFGDIVFEERPFKKLYNCCVHKDGHKVYTETSGEPIYDDADVLVGYRGIDFDRTQEISLQEQNSELVKALNNQYELLINVTNSISDLLFYKDIQYRYTGCNQAFSDFIGLPIDYIIGKTDYELFTKEFADTGRSIDKHIMEDLGEHSSYEWVKHANGKNLYLLIQKSPLFDTQSSLIGMVGLSRDLTHEHHLEEGVKEANNHLIDAQSVAKVGHWDWNIKEDILQWSDEIYKIFGYLPQEFCATYEAFVQTIHLEDRQKVSDAVNKALNEHLQYDIFHRIIMPDKTEKTVHEIGHALYDETDNAYKMIGTVQDVTLFQAMTKELKEQKEVFETIFESSGDGALLFKNGKFFACNQATIDILGFKSKEDVLKLGPNDISPEFQPDGQRSDEKLKSIIETCIKEGIHRFEWVHKRKNNEKFWVDITFTSLYIKNDLVIHAAWRDINDQKLLEADLEASNERYKDLIHDLDAKVAEQSAQMIKQSRMAQMGELLSMIAHQWRQPLSSITAITSAIKVKLALSTDSEVNLDFLDVQMDDIQTLTQSLSTTINDFRTLYKPDKGMKPTALNGPVDRAIKLIQDSLEKNNILIKKNYKVNFSIDMHANEVLQVILNLLKNSEDNFLEKKTKDPCICIETRVCEPLVQIMICDNGGGIKTDLIEKVFDPYFSTKDEKNGTGLGLYMSKIIIEQQHKGRLDVYNQDEGVCFCIELPMLQLL